MMLGVLESCCWSFEGQYCLLKATMPSLTALLTTKAEAWPVRLATHVMFVSRHTHHVTAQPLWIPGRKR